MVASFENAARRCRLESCLYYRVTLGYETLDPKEIIVRIQFGITTSTSAESSQVSPSFLLALLSNSSISICRIYIFSGWVLVTLLGCLSSI